VTRWTAALVVLIATTTAPSGCRSTPGEPAAQTSVDSASTLLIGAWTLVRGCGGITGQCRSPEAFAEPTRYRFRSDRNVDAYRGTDLLFTAGYSLVPGASDPRGDTRPSLLIGAGPTVDPRPLRVQFVGSDTLLLDEGCCDRYTFAYARAR